MPRAPEKPSSPASLLETVRPPGIRSRSLPSPTLVPQAQTLVPEPASAPTPRRWRGAVAAALVASTAAGAYAWSQPQDARGHAQAPPKTTPGGAAIRWWDTSVAVAVDDSMLAIDPRARDAAVAAFAAWGHAGAKLPSVSTSDTSGATPGYVADGPNVNAVLYAKDGWGPAG